MIFFFSSYAGKLVDYKRPIGHCLYLAQDTFVWTCTHCSMQQCPSESGSSSDGQTVAWMWKVKLFCDMTPCQILFTNQHDVKTQINWIFSSTIVTTPNPMTWLLITVFTRTCHQILFSFWYIQYKNHTLTCKIHYNIIFHLYLCLPHGTFCSCFWTKTFHVPHVHYILQLHSCSKCFCWVY